MHELLGVGIIILLGLAGGHLSHHFNIPRVTGYMLVGLVFGPSVTGLITAETLANVHLVNEIALGLILFAIGGEIEWNHLKSLGWRTPAIVLAESGLSFVAVGTVTYLISSDLGVAILLGSISIATAPGVTLLVIREYRARGTLTDHLLAVVALNNILCLLMFRVTFSIYAAMEGEAWTAIGFALLKELVASILIGGIVGGIITLWEQKLDDLSELLLVIIGGLLLGIGLAREVGISTLMVCLIIGAVTNNLSMMHRLVYAELRQTEMPFYIAFFVLSGASLHLDKLTHLGMLGLAYLVVRPVAKAVGAWWMARKTKADAQVVSNLGMALLPQAGVAIGMVLTVTEKYPAMGTVVGTVILSSVIVYEGIGPFLTRLALARAGEVHLQE